MRLSTNTISSVTSYTKMSEPTTPQSSTNLNAKKFEGDGLSFKGKLIGMEDLHVDRDEKICLDAMFKLKAVVKARGEHKQRIQFNLTMNAVNIIDDTTKVQIVSHAIERISFVVIDPRDTRAFGYIFNTTDNRHQFWAIKTERAAAASVLALKELFEVAFEQFTNTQKAKVETNPISTSTQNSSANVVVVEQSTPITTTTTPSLIDDFWGSTPTTSAPVVTTPPPPPPPSTTTNNDNLWDFNAEPLPVILPAAPKPVDPLDDILGDLILTQPTPLPSTNTLLNLNPFIDNINPMPQTQTSPHIPRMAPPPPTQALQQQNSQAPRSLSPVAPPSLTNPFSDFDFLDNLSTGTAAPRPTKESFFPPTQPPKTIQQLQMEKQS